MTSGKLSRKFSFEINSLFNEPLSLWFLEHFCGLLVMFIYNQNIFTERYYLYGAVYVLKIVV